MKFILFKEDSILFILLSLNFCKNGITFCNRIEIGKCGCPEKFKRNFVMFYDLNCHLLTKLIFYDHKRLLNTKLTLPIKGLIILMLSYKLCDTSNQAIYGQ